MAAQVVRVVNVKPHFTSHLLGILLCLLNDLSRFKPFLLEMLLRLFHFGLLNLHPSFQLLLLQAVCSWAHLLVV